MELLEDWVTRLNFVTCVLELLEVTVVVGLDVGVVLAIVKVVVVIFCVVLAIVEVVVNFSIFSSSLNRFLAWRMKLGDWK